MSIVATHKRSKKAKAGPLPDAAHADVPAPTVSLPADHFELIDLERISESKTNPRHIFKGLEELADSIAEKGVIEPLIVRPVPSPAIGETFQPGPDTRYELVAGARRYRASKLAAKKTGHTTVPCMIRCYSEVQACEVQVIENNQREDVHPLEEAGGFAHLVELGQTVTDIAAKIGRPEAYVAKRLQLTKLIKPARQMLEKDQIAIGHAMELCRLSTSAQERMVKHINECLRGWHRSAPELRELRQRIGNDLMRELSSARWKHDDAALVPTAGACATCPKNTNNQRALFDDVDRKHPTCTDPDCFESKQTAFVQLAIKKLTDSGVKPLLLSDSGYHSPAEKKRFTDAYGSLPVSQWNVQVLTPKEAKKTDKAKPAVYVDGDEYGRVVQVTPDSGRGASAIAADERYKAQQRRKEQQARFATVANQKILDAILPEVPLSLSGDVLRLLIPLWFDRVYGDYQRVLCSRRGWKSTKKGDYGWQGRAMRQFVASAKLSELASFAVELSLVAATKVSPHYSGDRKEQKVLDQVARLFGLKPDSLRQKAIDEQKAAAKAGKKKAKPQPSAKGKPAAAEPAIDDDEPDLDVVDDAPFDADDGEDFGGDED
jgi:ParB family chromosome partitioning protein